MHCKVGYLMFPDVFDVQNAFSTNWNDVKGPEKWQGQNRTSGGEESGT